MYNNMLNFFNFSCIFQILCYFEGWTFHANGKNLLDTETGNNACIDPKWEKDLAEQVKQVKKEREASSDVDDKVARYYREQKKERSKRARSVDDALEVEDSASDDDELDVHTQQMIHSWSSPSAALKRQRKMGSGRKQKKIPLNELLFDSWFWLQQSAWWKLRCDCHCRSICGWLGVEILLKAPI